LHNYNNAEQILCLTEMKWISVLFVHVVVEL